MKEVSIPFSGSNLTRNSSSNVIQRDQIFSNCFSYAVSDSISGGTTVKVVKRNGYSLTSVATTDQAHTGAVAWLGAATPKVVFSFNTGASVVKFYDQNSNAIGGTIATSGDCPFLTETVISGTANLVAIIADSSTGANEAWFYPDGGAWTQITDTDFPPNQTPAIPITGAPVHMDGFMFIMCTNGQVWNSDLNSVSSWSANSFISAQNSPDAGKALGKSGDYIVAFGTASIEFMVNNGNPTGSPLSVVPNVAKKIGLVANNIIRNVGESIYFVGTDGDTGQIKAYRLLGTQVEVISTPDVDVFMVGCQGVIGTFRTPTGFEHVVFDMTAGAWCYCIQTKKWWYTTFNAVAFANLPNSTTSYFSFGAAGAGGSIGTIVPAGGGYQDNGSAMTMTIQTAAMSMGTQLNKFWRYLTLTGDKQSSAATVTVSYSDDDAVTFTTAGTIDMSVAEPVKLVALGCSKRRVWKFVNTSNTPMSLESFKIGYDIGTV